MCMYTGNKMRPGIRLGVTWSLEELKKLVNDESSCVCMEQSKKHVALQPIHLNDLNKAFQDILDSWINVYDSQFNGLLLAYKNPKLISQLGTILYDSHFIHVDIVADFYIFRPELHSVLTGVINKKANNYVGVLVHKVFNVSIPKKEEDENWDGQHLEVGDDVTFTIEHLDLKGKLPFIRGKLLSSNKSTQRASSGSTSHKFFDSNEELNNDDTKDVETANKQPNKSERPSFLSSRASDSSDEETQAVDKLVKNLSYEEAQTVDEVVKKKKRSKSHKKSIQDEEEISEEQFDLPSTNTTHDEDEYNSVMLNGTEKSKKSSKKDKKKKSKHKDRYSEEENNTLHNDSSLNQSANTSMTENELPTKKSKKHKYENTEESNYSESHQKIRKHKKKNKTPESDEHNNFNDEGEEQVSNDNEIDTSRVVAEKETHRKSKKKRKEKIKVEQNYEQSDFNETETNSLSFNSDIDHFRDSFQTEQSPKSSKKSSKHKSKLKEKIKEEPPNSFSDYEIESNQTLELDSEANKSVESSQSNEDQNNLFHSDSNINTHVPEKDYNEFEMPTKSAKKRKRSSAHGNFLAVKIKEEPVSDSESSYSTKSKRRRKDPEDIDDSFNNLDTDTSEINSSKHMKNKEKESVNDVPVSTVRVKQEIVVKEETSKKKKQKDGNQSSLNIKQESTSSDVEGTAVKKKIKILFTE